MPSHIDTLRPRRAWGLPFGRLVLAIVGAIAVVLSLILWVPRTTANAASANTLWGTAAPSGLVNHSDRAGVELGTRFTVKNPGIATGVRFWKTSSSDGSHAGSLWTSSGRKLATVRFTHESASGWQVAEFPKPVALKAGETYVVSYFAPHGGYADTYDFRGSAKSTSLAVKAGAGVFRYGSSSRFPTKVWRNSQYWVDLNFVPAGRESVRWRGWSRPPAHPKPPASQSPSPTASPAPTPTKKPIPAPTATPAPTPTTPAKPTAGFPDAGNTGVPAGTALSGYTGPCTITAANTVIDAKTIDCSLTIRAKNVTISRSVLNGTVYADTDGSGSFTISDSQVNVGPQMGTGIGAANFTATRVHVTGGNRSINCAANCTVEGSYVHGQFTDRTGAAHESGIRMGSGSVISGNTIACDAPDVAPDAGCSAALTGYGDFAIVQNNTINGNLFIGGSGGYCAYGGSTSGKAFSTGVNKIRFTNNVFQRGESGKCGWFGPITSFDTRAPGNVWSNNTYDNGATVAPAD